MRSPSWQGCLFPYPRQAKYSENKLKCTKARNDYLLNLAATNAAVSKYYIHDVSDLIDLPGAGCGGAAAWLCRTARRTGQRRQGLGVCASAAPTNCFQMIQEERFPFLPSIGVFTVVWIALCGFLLLELLQQAHK
ncbi:hypothetical protein AV530_017774 [Patagioenas fasciata monilis]|uniref:Uncharacterized protein n=1 Tax=Patagioenas fasciata monilis TaxID=372326 RepID=A0A1V4KCP3_PATFA|nr:hypothetical protein AV530_017774 [Patagioenas fasciata monilis]